MELAHPRAATTDIGQLAAQVKLVSSLELAVVAAIPLRSPRSGLVVLLDNDGLSTAAFCELPRPQAQGGSTFRPKVSTQMMSRGSALKGTTAASSTRR